MIFLLVQAPDREPKKLVVAQPERGAHRGASRRIRPIQARVEAVGNHHEAVNRNNSTVDQALCGAGRVRRRNGGEVVRVPQHDLSGPTAEVLVANRRHDGRHSRQSTGNPAQYVRLVHEADQGVRRPLPEDSDTRTDRACAAQESAQVECRDGNGQTVGLGALDDGKDREDADLVATRDEHPCQPQQLRLRAAAAETIGDKNHALRTGGLVGSAPALHFGASTRHCPTTAAVARRCVR